MREVFLNQNIVKKEISPIIKEKKEATADFDVIQKMNKFFYFFGAVTKDSKFGRNEEDADGKERPFFLRNRRARLLKELKKFPESKKFENGEIVQSRGREEVIENARKLDNITEQYLNQHEISIDLPNYGIQKSRIIELNGEGGENQIPIFLIPGCSEDVECMGNLMTEAALHGRRIISAGYPESYMGETTQEFAEGVEKDPGFGPHTEYFKAILKSVFEKNQNIELWGASTGAPIVSSILKDKEFQNKTKNAVLIFPASSVDQNVSNIKMGAAKEFKFLLKKFKRFASATWGDNDLGIKSKEKRELHDKINEALVLRDSKKDTAWKEAKVMEGGNIIVLSGGNDEITKSYKAENEFKDGNEQIKTFTIPDAYHNSMKTEPEKVMNAISKLEKGNS